MKTFTTTVCDLRFKHFIHFLGVALGLFLITGYTYALIKNGPWMLEGEQYRAIATFSLMVLFGAILITPKQTIKRRKTTRLIYYVSSAIFLLHMFSVMLSYKELNWVYVSVDSSMILIAVCQLPLIMKSSDPDDADNPCNPPRNSKNQLDD